jgi:WD40 repeat protein
LCLRRVVRNIILMRMLRGHRWAVRAVAFCPADAGLLASAGDDRVIRLWRPAAGDEPTDLARAAAGVLALAFSPDGRRLVSGDRGGALAAWDVASGQPAGVFGGRDAPVVSLGAAACGAVVSLQRRPTVAGPGRLAVWPPGGAPLAQAAPGPAVALALSADGLRLALACDDRTCRLIGPGLDDAVLTFGGVALGLAFDPTAAVLAAGCGATVEVWDVASRQRRAVARGHRGLVYAVAFAPDGAAVLSGSADGTVRLWSAEEARPLAAHRWEVGPVYAVAVAPDGQTAAAGGGRGPVVVWDLG